MNSSIKDIQSTKEINSTKDTSYTKDMSSTRAVQKVHTEARQLLNDLKKMQKDPKTITDTTEIQAKIHVLKNILRRCQQDKLAAQKRERGYMSWMSSSSTCKERQLRSSMSSPNMYIFN